MENSILILSPIGLGNFLMCLPTLREVRKQNPNSQIHLLALRGGVKDLAEPTQLFDKIHLWDPDKQGMLRGVSILKEIRKAKLKTLYHLFPTGHWKYALFRKALGIPNQIGFNYGHWGDKLNKVSLDIDCTLHDTEQNFRLVSESIEQISPLAWEPPTCELKIPHSYFVMHPGSSAERMMEHKRMPPKSYAALASLIKESFGISAVLIGGPEEKELREEIKTYAPHAFLDIATKSLYEAAHVCKEALFYLGNDSGLMHLSNSVGTPVFSVFGPTDESRTGPWQGTEGPFIKVIRNPKASCGPCWALKNLGSNPPCPTQDYSCLQEFDPTAIYFMIKEDIQTLL